MNKILLLLFFLLSACVTINIYFPAAAVDKAADKIIKDIQKIAPDAKKIQTHEPESRLPQWQLTLYQIVDGALNILITPGYAQEVDLSVNSTEIRRFRALMKARFSLLKSFYDKGYIGVTNEGLVSIKKATSIPLRLRNKVNKLVEDENSNRERLYRAIANANGHPEWYGAIKSTFAKRWISNARSGWWYQSSNNNWKKK
ncbi:MAG: YdbL family protein [Methylococcales bacterium]|nr:YdbL family protein [Methylococcales bacterium]